MIDPLDNKYNLNCTFVITGEVKGEVKQGSGFSINENQVITAWHVVKNMSEIKIFTTTDNYINDNNITSSISSYDEDLDIAILNVENAFFSNYVNINASKVQLNIPVESCGYPKEKAGKHAIMDTNVSNIYDRITTENHSFELNQIDGIKNYSGMSGSPIIHKGHVIGILLVQQAGVTLYCISFVDILNKLEHLNEFLTIENTEHDVKRVLFNHYTLASEMYYLETTLDEAFNRSLDINNIWIFGKSGTGKTAVINRNLTKNNVNYIYCDLSPVNIESERDVLNEILLYIEDAFDSEREHSERNVIKQISKIICNKSTCNVVVVIDELGVDDEVILSNIAKALVKLVSYVTHNHKEDSLKFAVSTIKSPGGLLNNTGKASDYFQFLSCDHWNCNLEELFDLISLKLKINVINMKDEILSKSDNSPRILKSIFKNIMSEIDITDETINNAILKTIREAVL